MSDPWTCLVTGGAGFIGSSIVDALVGQGHEVRVLDDLSTGYAVQLNPEARLIIGSVDDLGTVRTAVDECDVVFHQAAHRAVLRSVEHPLATDSANTHGTLTVLDAAREAGVRRVVYASSSSVYGGAEMRPTPESAPLQPKSPYAVSKLAGEHYCRVFTELYGIETFALRYFNVYGPRQRPESQYAAVIPLFIEALRRKRPPVVHGDGKQSRDFTYISDVVAANLAAANAPSDAAGRAYNIAAGDEHSLLDLLEILGAALGVDPQPERADPRPGDVRHTSADVSAAERELGWRAKISFEEGLKRTTEWFTQDDS